MKKRSIIYACIEMHTDAPPSSLDFSNHVKSLRVRVCSFENAVFARSMLLLELKFLCVVFVKYLVQN